MNNQNILALKIKNPVKKDKVENPSEKDIFIWSPIVLFNGVPLYYKKFYGHVYFPV